MNKKSRYDNYIKNWNLIFEKDNSKIPSGKKSGNTSFDDGLLWLTENASSIIDFGCGSGTVLFLCEKYGTKQHIGIDLSAQAIKNAKKKSSQIKTSKFDFITGGVEELMNVADSSIDAAILSNILDNLYPEDANKVISEIKRILVPDGRLLVKLNPYITSEQIQDWNINILEDNLLDDGMLIWNNTTEHWNNLLAAFFDVKLFQEIYYEKQDLYNRMYYLVNK